MLRCIVFFYGHFLRCQRKQPLKCCPSNRCSQNPGNFYVKYLWKRSYIFNKIARERPAARLKRNSLHFLNILPRFWATLHFFPKFSELFCRKPFIVCLWFKWHNDLCNVTLHVSRRCWKTLWIDPSIAFIHDIPPKRIKWR